MVAHYNYVFNSMRSERVILELDMFGVYMSMSLNGATSQFGATCQLDQTGKRNIDIIEATEPGRNFVVVERNGVPIGAWVVWSRTYSAQSKTLQLSGIPFDAYPSHARILTPTIFNNVEQLEIFRQLWIQMQSVYGRNINVNVPGGGYPLITPKSLEVQRYDAKYYGEVMSSIADSANGFDWYIALTKEGNYYRKDLRIGFPRLGTPMNSGMTVYEYPGNVTQYYFTESMSDAGNNVLVIGAGEGEDMLISEVNYGYLVDGGYPRWDTDIARKEVDNQAILNAVAPRLAEFRRGPVTTIKMTVKGDAVPEFGSYNLGDASRIVIKDPRHPTGFSKDTRMISWTLRPATSDQVEEADLVFEGDEPNDA